MPMNLKEGYHYIIKLTHRDRYCASFLSIPISSICQLTRWRTVDTSPCLLLTHIKCLYQLLGKGRRLSFGSYVFVQVVQLLMYHFLPLSFNPLSLGCPLESANQCLCREAGRCSDGGISVCVEVEGSVARQTMTECEAGILKCHGENVSVVSIRPCDGQSQS